VAGYLCEDATAIEAPVGEPVLPRMVKSAGRGEESPQGTEGGAKPKAGA
jgi:hypothetical protein